VTGSPELRFRVPWRDIVLTAGIAWAGAALAIAVAAWQAGRVAPAEALRTV
jgi:ABC-type lipoprotein release transport system permease subunit